MLHSAGDRARSRLARGVARVAALIPFLFVACQSGTEPRRAEVLAIATQAPGTAQSGVTLSSDPVVELHDGDGALIAEAGVSITAAVVEPGATLGGTTTRVTDANGRATFSGLVIGGTAGTYTVRFSANGMTAVSSTPVVLRAGSAATLAAASPLALQGTVGAPIASPPSVVAKDASGNVVPDVVVTYVAGGVGSTLTGASPATTTTGVAALGGWTLPTTAGQYTVRATIAGVVTGAVTFTATAVADAPQTMQANGGQGQSALYGDRLAAPLQVRVVDQYGNPTPGIVVTWGSLTGAGTVEPIDVGTDASGVARSNYRVGTTPGENVVRASINPRSLSADMSVTARGFTNQLGAGWHHSCALDDTGVAWCWGENDQGQVGDGTTANRTAPTAVGGALRFRRLSVGASLTCGVTTDDLPYCWGSNAFGAIGDGTTTDRLVPTLVAGGQHFVEITTTGVVTCGLTSAGAAWCWGGNFYSLLGVGGALVESCISRRTGAAFECSRVPLPVAGGLTFASIAAGSSHACALRPSGQLYCWGTASAWAPLTSGPDYRDAPVLADPSHSYGEVTVGDYHTCGIAAPSSAYCWGNDNYGDLGNGPGAYHQDTPTLLSGIAAAHMDAGGVATCAVLTDGRAACWGYNDTGAVGDGTLVNRPTPTVVASSETFAAVSTSGDHACGRTARGQVYCWGSNVQGQLGIGSDSWMLTPSLARP